MRHMWPRDTIAAVTAPDPYPYYGHLAVTQPLFFDAGLGMWVATSANAVTAVLTSDLCRVRPIDEPAPATLAGTAAGDLFARLIRMTDHVPRASVKQAVASTLGSLENEVLARLSRDWASELLLGSDKIGATERPPFAFALPVVVLGDLLGIPRELLAQTACWIDAFVTCLATGASASQIAEGIAGAGHLRDLMQRLIADGACVL